MPSTWCPHRLDGDRLNPEAIEFSELLRSSVVTISAHGWCSLGTDVACAEVAVRPTTVRKGWITMDPLIILSVVIVTILVLSLVIGTLWAR